MAFCVYASALSGCPLAQNGFYLWANFDQMRKDSEIRTYSRNCICDKRDTDGDVSLVKMFFVVVAIRPHWQPPTTNHQRKNGVAVGSFSLDNIREKSEECA